ncbi:unnamed protein product, partial [Cuscuta epithymum]
MVPTEEELKDERIVNALEKIRNEKACGNAVSNREKRGGAEGTRRKKNQTKVGGKRKSKRFDVGGSVNAIPTSTDGSESLLIALRQQGERIEKLEHTIKKLCDLQVKQASMIKKLLVNVKKGKAGVIGKFNFLRKKREPRYQDIPSFDLAPEFNEANDGVEQKEAADVSMEFV